MFRSETPSYKKREPEIDEEEMEKVRNDFDIKVKMFIFQFRAQTWTWQALNEVVNRKRLDRPAQVNVN
jgi:hypothetical protein